MRCAPADGSDAVAALLESMREISLSIDREDEAAVAVDCTRRLQDKDAAIARRDADAQGAGAAQVRHVLSPANAAAAAQDRLSGPLASAAAASTASPLHK
jgi:hypothetical protein